MSFLVRSQDLQYFRQFAARDSLSRARISCPPVQLSKLRLNLSNRFVNLLPTPEKAILLPLNVGD